MWSSSLIEMIGKSSLSSSSASSGFGPSVGEEEEVAVVEVVEEETCGGGEVGRVEEVGAEAGGSGIGIGWCFLQLRQGLLSESTSLRRRLVRTCVRACGADVDADVDASSTVSTTVPSVSSGGTEAGRLMPTTGVGSGSVYSASLCCCCC
jgi:hypothetical protein